VYNITQNYITKFLTHIHRCDVPVWGPTDYYPDPDPDSIKSDS